MPPVVPEQLTKTWSRDRACRYRAADARSARSLTKRVRSSTDQPSRSIRPPSGIVEATPGQTSYGVGLTRNFSWYSPQPQHSDSSEPLLDVT